MRWSGVYEAKEYTNWVDTDVFPAQSLVALGLVGELYITVDCPSWIACLTSAGTTLSSTT